MGIVIGLAISGSLFSSFENRELVSQVRATGATKAQESDVRGLLSGSEAAEQHVRSLTGASRAVVERITDEAFTHGLRFVMILALVLSVISIWPALWGRRKPARADEHPKIAHPLWSSLWQRHQHRVPTGSTPAS